MGKKYGWLAIVFIAAAVLYLIPVEAKQGYTGELDGLLRAVRATGAEIQEAETRTRVELGTVTSPKELGELAYKWSNRFDLVIINDLQLENGRYTFHSQANFQHVAIDLRLVGVPYSAGLDAYLVLILRETGSEPQDIEKLQQQVETAFRAAGIIPQFSTCIRGMYSDKLGDDQQEGKILSIFRSLQANEIERLQDETVISVSGYTPVWKQSLNINGRKMNLQAATHRDTQSPGTRLTVGTPIITAEY
ncbi:YwmB family TATA-box binding protein [Brevibacillus fulvus]|uniref:TATA-box binding n=1 Tax=Brevibacillus fulvus TaxID=1125967 RepID=A0A938XYR9_9BACL|nr:YwmB family TATA-box binding protein [Brevibacillus fulvus]MBM7590165.1 hypothetical protein [Brevibacillus fulvus]